MTTNNDNANDTSNTNINAEATTNAGGAAFAGGIAPEKPLTLREATLNATNSYGFRGSYLLLKPRYDEMPADNLPPVTIDVNKIIVLGMRVLPEAEKLSADIKDECPRLPEDLIDQVRQALFGLAHANILKQLAAAGGPSESASEAAAPLRLVRDHLVGDINPLVVRGLVPPQAVVLSPGNNPRNVAFDVLRLVEVTDTNYHHLEGQSKTTRADLQAAAKAAQDLLEQLGAKEQFGDSLEDATLTRLRALAFFVALYEELRWGVRFVRRKHKDAHLFMPSLFTLRKKRSNAAAEDADDDAPEVQPTPAATADASGIDLAHLQTLMNGGGQPTTAPNPTPATPNSGGVNTGGVNTGGSGAR